MRNPNDLTNQSDPNNNNANFTEQVPGECWTRIFNLLTLRDKSTATRVCKRWNGLLNENFSWENEVEQYGVITGKIKHMGYKKFLFNAREIKPKYFIKADELYNLFINSEINGKNYDNELQYLICDVLRIIPDSNKTQFFLEALLIKYPLNINQKIIGNYLTLLHFFTICCNYNAVKFLIDKGAKINLTCNGKSALYGITYYADDNFISEEYSLPLKDIIELFYKNRANFWSLHKDPQHTCDLLSIFQANTPNNITIQEIINQLNQELNTDLMAEEYQPPAYEEADPFIQKNAEVKEEEEEEEGPEIEPPAKKQKLS